MSSNKKNKYSELDVEKLNIVDKNGKVKMKLFTQDNIPPLIMDGEDILPDHRQNDPISGLMFYNGKGEETGGLIYGSEEDETGNLHAGASLTFDQYEQDQVVQMSYVENSGKRSYGFSIYDRPDASLSKLIKKQNEINNTNLTTEEKEEAYRDLYKGNAPRAFMGKEENGEVSMKLMDSKGNPRIRLVVDENDVPRMEFLNGKGEVTYKLSPEE